MEYTEKNEEKSIILVLQTEKTLNNYNYYDFGKENKKKRQKKKSHEIWNLSEKVYTAVQVFP